MTIKKLEYFRDTGTECARCGSPIDTWVLRNSSNQLNWRVLAHGEHKAFNAHGAPQGWRLQLVRLDSSGVYCQACAKRDDRDIGVSGSPHKRNKHQP